MTEKVPTDAEDGTTPQAVASESVDVSFLDQSEDQMSPYLIEEGIEEVDNEERYERIVRALKEIYDPEIPINIYDMGLIYEIRQFADDSVYVQMTLTTPGCPVAQTFPSVIEQKVRSVEGVGDVEVDLVWDPPWTPERMTEESRLELGILF